MFAKLVAHGKSSPFRFGAYHRTSLPVNKVWFTLFRANVEVNDKSLIRFSRVVSRHPWPNSDFLLWELSLIWESGLGAATIPEAAGAGLKANVHQGSAGKVKRPIRFR